MSEHQRPAGLSSMQEAADSLRQAASSMNDATAAIATKRSVDDATLEQAATDVLSAAGSLGGIAESLGDSLSEMIAQKAADENEVRRALTLFGRAAGELNNAWGVLSELLALKAASAAADQFFDDEALARVVDRVKLSARELERATEAFDRHLSDLVPDPEREDSPPKPPADDIALKKS